ncbi:hypothetical protein [Pediococcus acidilactici]|uniref:hypothetical protein n=1 Tax=Pediococcus acidilactici TaxID=1254 RepID=UPI00232F25A4|nr:hypothetical protein [Pediococcus acidilactici]MDB8860126.1 hypothetical protein [Pediococcus acidilactici]MDB8861123.1 hypothetical protein [Pediococcus acidilactici]MDB8863836.1 hypothetical protein [Pediococcus acidilactici]MDB8866014.1 hypothetical protein [Pediococcus acidilactici]
MIDNAVYEFMSLLPGSFINSEGELILVQELNLFIQIQDKNRTELTASLLEYCSRDAVNSRKFGKLIMSAINAFVKRDLSKEDYKLIYKNLGNRINPKLTHKFIANGFEISVLENQTKGQMSLVL